MRGTSDRLNYFRQIEAEPYRFDYFQAMRRIECLHADLPRLGASQRPAAEPLRLGQEAAEEDRLFWINDQLRVRIEDRTQQAGAGFGVTANEDGVFTKRVHVLREQRLNVRTFQRLNVSDKECQIDVCKLP